METLSTAASIIEFFDGQLSGNYVVDLDEAEYGGVTFAEETYTEALNLL